MMLFFIEAWLAAFLWRREPEEFYSAYIDCIYDICGRAAPSDTSIKCWRQSGREYIRTAKAKGASKKRIIIKHALRNALMPVVTTLGTSFGASLGGAIIAETVFTHAGYGYFDPRQSGQRTFLWSWVRLCFLAVLFQPDYFAGRYFVCGDRPKNHG